MSDWQVGDLAVCVDASPARQPYITSRRLCAELVQDRTYSVCEVRVASCGTISLRFPGFDWSTTLGGEAAGFDHRRFRKIRPDKREQCEPEFVTLLKRIKPKVPASGMPALPETVKLGSAPKEWQPGPKGTPMTTRQTRKEGDR